MADGVALLVVSSCPILKNGKWANSPPKPKRCCQSGKTMTDTSDLYPYGTRMCGHVYSNAHLSTILDPPLDEEVLRFLQPGMPLRHSSSSSDRSRSGCLALLCYSGRDRSSEIGGSPTIFTFCGLLRQLSAHIAPTRLLCTRSAK